MKTIRRIILLHRAGTSKKLPDHVKMLLKSFGGYWDDLFDGWSLPIDCAQRIQAIIRDCGITVEIKEVNLPESHVKERGKDRVMYGKYATLLKKIQNDERALCIDIAKYQKNTKPPPDKEDDRPMFPYKKPSPEGKNETAFMIENEFYRRYSEICLLRQEINQIHRELLEHENNQKNKEPSL